jgi:flagellar biosynthesis/type III secretory pathway chaperone
MDAQTALPTDEVLVQSLQAAPGLVERLSQCLMQEFEALKERDLPAFEALQEPKGQVLEQLSALAQWCSQIQPAPAAWQALREQLLQSREAHLRNIQLLQRQLEAVRGTLQALQGESSAPAVDLYDRSGLVSRRYSAWSHHLA